MIIKKHTIEEIREFSVDLLSKTFLQLRQNPTEDDIVSLAIILAEDLKEDFEKLEFQDIEQAFRLGIRNTDDFVVGVKTWYRWIKRHRQVIWDNESIEPERQDKRLKYRSRKGTGMKQIDIKQIKKLR